MAWLDASEKYALSYFLQKFRTGGSETYPLAESVADGMFQLYVQGRTLKEIFKLNPQYGFGQIVYAAAERNWDAQRQQRRAEAMDRAKERASGALADSVELVSDMLAAETKLHADNLARFLQTGDKDQLGSALSMTTIRNLKELSDLLLKLTGQENKKTVTGTVRVEHSTAPPVGSAPVAEGTSGPNPLRTWAEQKRLAEKAKKAPK